MRLFALLLAFAICPALTVATNTGFPFTDETLNYNILWPSGLSLGEGHLTARKAGTTWNLLLTLEAGVPGFAVKDAYTSSSNLDLCAGTFSKKSVHGAKKVDETATVDTMRNVLIRATVNGGKSELPVQDCMKDALGYLFWGRRELGQGRVPKSQPILFGATYQASLQYTGAEVIRVGDQSVQSDKLICTFKGPASDIKFEMYVARDPARTPLLFRVPIAMGTFSMELVR